jgi:hypothetical protein
LAATIKQPSDKSGPSNDHHSSEQVFESKEARRSRVVRQNRSRNTSMAALKEGSRNDD